MRDTYYEDTGVGREYEGIESTHSYNAHPKCEHCDFRTEELLHLSYWMEDACDQSKFLDVMAGETLIKLFQLLRLLKCTPTPSAGSEF